MIFFKAINGRFYPLSRVQSFHLAGSDPDEGTYRVTLTGDGYTDVAVHKADFDRALRSADKSAPTKFIEIMPEEADFVRLAVLNAGVILDSLSVAGHTELGVDLGRAYQVLLDAGCVDFWHWPGSKEQEE